MSSEPVLALRNVSHFFGEGELRRQVLYDVSAAVEPGEIVLLTGPSGSGKTTLLTLAGALRSLQQGSIRIFDHELKDAPPAQLTKIREGIGFIFQNQNLLESQTAIQNVELSLGIRHDLPKEEVHAQCRDALEMVGLGGHLEQYPHQLSGGQKQRVAIARALVRKPRIVLADEPTASLDRQSGREVVELMQSLVRRQNCAILLVTHDNRILDIADRVLTLEDGRMASLPSALNANSGRLLAAISQLQRNGSLLEYIRKLPGNQFQNLMHQISQELEWFLETLGLGTRQAIETLIAQILEAVTLKLKQMLGADQASLFIVDPERNELYSRIARNMQDVHLRTESELIGPSALPGKSATPVEPGASPFFDFAFGHEQEFLDRRLLCMPIFDRKKSVVAVLQMFKRPEDPQFTDDDEQNFSTFAEPLGMILESSLEIANQNRSLA
jgi:putative ABC transport system ATP-binding protein